MTLESHQSQTFTLLDQEFVHLTGLLEAMQTGLSQTRSASIPTIVYEGVAKLPEILSKIRSNVITLEEERRNLRSLATIGGYVNSSLDLEVVLQIVMDTIIRITGAERGFLMLRNEMGELAIRMARNWVQESIEPTEFAISSTVVNRVVESGQPILTTNAQEDQRFSQQNSIVAFNLRSILCVPLKVKEDITGVLYADNRVRSGIFTQKDLDLLTAFSNEAAVAIENARLFNSVRHTLEEVTELKGLMDNVFSSIASGVLTADIEERVNLCNRAAEAILGQSAGSIVGGCLNDVLPPLVPVLRPYIQQVMKEDQQVVGLETNSNLPTRGQVDLRFNLSPLKDANQITQGVAIVLEDLTEKKKLEAQRRLLERMVSPAVIEQLDLNNLQLGGRKATISVLFADIRGYTGFSEDTDPENLVQVLNHYLAAAADVILNEGGTIDKFLGDAVMAWFNAPVPQKDHTMRAIRSALGIREAMKNVHEYMPANLKLSFGVGIHVGEAVLGLVGTEKRLDYTAIGDCINTAKRIQENAGPEQILISYQALQEVSGQVNVRAVEPILAKGKKEPIVVFQVLEMH